MSTTSWVRLYRLLFGLLTLGTIAFQFWTGLQRPDFRPANFWSFFTIQSNLIAALVLLWGASGLSSRRPSSIVDLIRGAAVLYLSITGVVYGVLLQGYEASLQTAVPWVNNVLHRVMPIVMVMDWLIDPPRSELTFRSALVWLIYPLAYAAYTLVRGPLVDWYPYPFLNPARVGGYGVVALYCIGITVGALIFTWLVVLLGRHVRIVIGSNIAAAGT